MTPAELKATRHRLGLSARELAERLRLGRHGGRTVYAWERGEAPVPGPASVAIEMLAAAAAKER